MPETRCKRSIHGSPSECPPAHAERTCTRQPVHQRSNQSVPTGKPVGEGLRAAQSKCVRQRASEPLAHVLASLVSKDQARKRYSLNAGQCQATELWPAQTRARSSRRTNRADNVSIEGAADQHASGSGDPLIRVARTDVACISRTPTASLKLHLQLH